MFCLETSIPGYAADLSPVKPSKRRKRYFNFTVQESQKLVWFSPEKFQLFDNICSETDPNARIGIKYLRPYEDSDDVIVN